MGVLLRSAALGLAAGGRSSVAFAVPVAAAARRGHDVPALRALAALAVVGEAVTDKLPGVPSRLVAPQLAGRVVAGAAGAGALAVVDGRRVAAVLVAAVVGGAGAFAGSVVGASWRQWADDDGRLGSDTRAALVEDAVVLATAGALSR
jgi:uncharacterized membrane protein